MHNCMLRTLLAVMVVGGCGDELSPAGDLDPEVAPITEGTWYRPTAATTWQWQLLGTVNSSYDVNLYDVDLFDTPTSTIDALHTDGRTVICYFSAGSFENWRTDAKQFLDTDKGEPLDGWEGESWLDVRSAKVHAIMRARLDLAAEKGCDGVEPDNVDGFANDTGFDLTATDQLAFNRHIANEAHTRGLSVGLKNDGDQVEQLLDYYDFCLNEECHAFSECALYAPFPSAGKPVFNAEYVASAAEATTLGGSLCPTALLENLRTLILPLDLDDSFRITCD